jgi:hypothetical protein
LNLGTSRIIVFAFPKTGIGAWLLASRIVAVCGVLSKKIQAGRTHRRHSNQNALAGETAVTGDCFIAPWKSPSKAIDLVLLRILSGMAKDLSGPWQLQRALMVDVGA